MTECSQAKFEFVAHFSRSVVGDFAGGALTSDGGSLLLRQVDRRIGLLGRMAACFTNFRSQDRIAHGVEQMLAQRVYGLALGYEDLNDHDQLRHDPLMHVRASGCGAPPSPSLDRLRAVRDYAASGPGAAALAPAGSIVMRSFWPLQSRRVISQGDPSC